MLSTGPAHARATCKAHVHTARRRDSGRCAGPRTRRFFLSAIDICLVTDDAQELFPLRFSQGRGPHGVAVVRYVCVVLSRKKKNLGGFFLFLLLCYFMYIKQFFATFFPHYTSSSFFGTF